MHKTLIVLLFFCIPFSAFASDPKPTWVRVQSPHFTVFSDTNEKQARRLADQFEQMRAVFHLIVPTSTADSGAPIIVLALKDRKGFQALEPAPYLAKGQLNLAGLFQRGPDKNYILLRLDAQGEHPFATIYHEYTHLMLSKAPWLPLWLNEGLAEFYQNTDIHEKEVLLGQPSSDDILYLRENRLIPLTTLLKIDYSSPYYHEEQKGSVFYAESWALTHYIQVTDHQNNANRLRDYALLLLKGEDSVTAAQHVFGDLNRLQKDLQNYIDHGDYQMFRMKTVVTTDPASFQSRPVSDPEINAIRADVLIYSQRSEEAQKLLEATLREDPNNALAHEVMGFLKFQEHDMDAAKKWYGEAVQLDSQSFLAHYYFATLSMRGGDRGQDATIESSLRTAIKLNPAFAPSYDALAQFYFSRDEKFDDAHILNIQAIQLDPANINYRLNAASILSRQRSYPGAIGVLKTALTVAKTPEDTERIQTRLKQLEQFQASFNQAKNQPAGATVTTATSSITTTTSGTEKVIVFKKVDGKVTGMQQDAPHYPIGDSKGPQHTVKGILKNVQCSYPTVLSLTLDSTGKSFALYNNNYYKIAFTTANYEPDGDIKPCSGIEDMKASVKYAEVTDKNVAGQILAIELSK